MGWLSNLFKHQNDYPEVYIDRWYIHLPPLTVPTVNLSRQPSTYEKHYEFEVERYTSHVNVKLQQIHQGPCGPSTVEKRWFKTFDCDALMAWYKQFCDSEYNSYNKRYLQDLREAEYRKAVTDSYISTHGTLQDLCKRCGERIENEFKGE